MRDAYTCPPGSCNQCDLARSVAREARVEASAPVSSTQCYYCGAKETKYGASFSPSEKKKHRIDCPERIE